MRVLRRLATQSADDQHLLGRVADVVLAADDARDLHQHVVHRGGQVVRGRAVGAGHHEVLDLRVVEGDRSAHHVVDDGLAGKRDGEAPHRGAPLGLERRDLLGRVIAPATHHGCPLVGTGIGAHGVKLLGGLPGGVHRARRLQLVDAVAVDALALALAERALVPVEAHPPEHAKDLGLALGRGALAVGVLHAQDERATRVSGRKPVEQRGARTANMQRSGRAGREANTQRAVISGIHVVHGRQDSRRPGSPVRRSIGWTT